MDLTTFYLILSSVLFSLGVLGVLVRQNMLVILMCIELMLNASNLALVTFSRTTTSMDGQLCVIFVMAVAAAEAAVGLAIIIGLFRNYYSVSSSDAMLLRG